MPVFISYRHEQRLDAFILNERLLLEGIPAQLVLFDIKGQTSEDLYGSFCQQMSDATHWIGVLPECAAATALTGTMRISSMPTSRPRSAGGFECIGYWSLASSIFKVPSSKMFSFCRSSRGCIGASPAPGAAAAPGAAPAGGAGWPG